MTDDRRQMSDDSKDQRSEPQKSEPWSPLASAFVSNYGGTRRRDKGFWDKKGGWAKDTPPPGNFIGLKSMDVLAWLPLHHHRMMLRL
jgi:hypothetical protein